MADRKAIQARADAMLAQGVGKSEVFRQLSGQGLKDRQLAAWLAARHDPRARAEMSLHVNILVGLMVLQALILLAVGWQVATGFGLALTIIPLLFAWGFRKPYAGAYSGYLLLSIITVGRNLAQLFPITTGGLVGVALSVGMICYVFWIQRRLFPDMNFLGPMRKGGQFVFTT
ncbi:hypothetical protein CS062_03655 [Roseateles chitinivorans]|uniref:Permease n=1 Tax=Roseateles chitinivorans TaxID=2917965 RepID=A0A2G9CDS7_9BURK|nr:hypothetical protein [Roseateles chitinivorans]PIM54492.1 hypothetical protein CS062_03655 [Roseateles chitinivorans]